MADFIRFRFHGAHGCTPWDFVHIPNVDDTDVQELIEEKTGTNEMNGCFLKVEAEEIAHPGNEWLLKEAQRLRERAKSMEHEAFKLESLDTGRNMTPVMHIQV